MLKASDLRAGHGDRTVFDGLSLTLPAGRRAGLVGPNGAGKSTLLALLAGAATPERGSVTLGPGDRIGHLPQEPPGAGLTIDRLLGAAVGEVWALQARLDGARDALGIAHVPLDAPLGHLSGGEAALRDYPGAIVAASHDRAFLDAIGCDRRLSVRAGEVSES